MFSLSELSQIGSSRNTNSNANQGGEKKTTAAPSSSSERRRGKLASMVIGSSVFAARGALFQPINRIQSPTLKTGPKANDEKKEIVEDDFMQEVSPSHIIAKPALQRVQTAPTKASSLKIVASTSPTKSIECIEIQDSPIKQALESKPSIAVTASVKRDLFSPGSVSALSSLPLRTSSVSSPSIAPSPGKATPPTLQCMLCGGSLAMLGLDERNRHINKCLDKLNGNSSSAPPTASVIAPPSHAAASSAASAPPLSHKRKRSVSDSKPTSMAIDEEVEIASSSAASSHKRRSNGSSSVSPFVEVSVKKEVDVCVIEDEDDVQMTSSTLVNTESFSSSSTSAALISPSSSSSSSIGGMKRAITDFFGFRGGAGGGSSSNTATVVAQKSKSTVTTAAPSLASTSPHTPSLQRPHSLPLPCPSDSTSNTVAESSTTSSAPAVAVDMSDQEVNAEATAAAAALTNSKASAVWKFILTGQATGSIAAPTKDFGRNSKGGSNNNNNSNGGSSFGNNGMNRLMYNENGERVYKLPAFKLLPNTNITIDAFMHTRAVLNAVPNPLWFLSHFHADHYAGLSAKWTGLRDTTPNPAAASAAATAAAAPASSHSAPTNHSHPLAGVIYCSEITSRLVRNSFGAALRVIPLPLHERIELPGEVRVTLIDAHHCPGAAICIFETKPLQPARNVNYSFLPPQESEHRKKINDEALVAHERNQSLSTSAEVTAKHRFASRYGKVYVHGGDMRYHPSMRSLFLAPDTPVPSSGYALTSNYQLTPHLLPFLPDHYQPIPYPSLAFQPQLEFLRHLRVDAVFLDTTYCNPRYRFPSQAISIAHTLAVVGECLSREQKYGVSNLVEGNAKKKVVHADQVKTFFQQFALNSNAAIVTSSPVKAPPPTAAATSASTSITAHSSSSDLASPEGVSSFLSQAPTGEMIVTSESAPLEPTDATQEMDALDDDEEPNSTEEEDALPAEDALSEVENEEQEKEIQEEQGNGMLNDSHEPDDDHEHQEQSPDPAADVEEEAELEDLMMRDYDHRCEEDEVVNEDTNESIEDNVLGAQPSQSVVGAAVSSMWNSMKRSLSLSSNFLSGYKKQAISKTLFLVGSYSIGKEKIFIEIARQFGLKIYVPSYRLRTIKMLDLFDGAAPATNSSAAAASNNVSSSTSSSSSSSSLSALPSSTHFSAPTTPTSSTIKREWKSWHPDSVLTTKIDEARLHVIPLSHINHKLINSHLDPALNQLMPGEFIQQFQQVVAFRPTGWVGNKPSVSEKSLTITIPAPYRMVKDTTPLPKGVKNTRRKMIKKEVGKPRKHSLNVVIHGVPYSEHSTFPELSAFIETLAAAGLSEIIPTVSAAQCAPVVKNTWMPLLHKQQLMHGQPVDGTPVSAPLNSSPSKLNGQQQIVNYTK